MTVKGRPINPIAWGSGNYSAGADPWSGLAKRVPNGARAFTPGVALAAEEANDIAGELVDDVTAAYNLAGQQAALNWPSGSADVTVGGSLPAYNGIAYDLKYGRWLIYGEKLSTTNAFCAYGSSNGGRTWYSQGGQNPSTGTPNCSIRGVIYNPTTGRLAVCTYPDVSDVSPLVDEEARLTLGSTSGHVSGIAFGGLYIFVGNNNNTTPLVQTSPLGGTNVWTTRAPTFAAPSTWATSSGYATASSGSMAVGVALLKANYGEYITSTDGITWTVRTHTFSSGWYNVGLCWAGDRFALMQTNGTDSRIVYSLDGVNWLSGATLTGSVAGGVAAIGALMFATTYTHGDIRGVFCTDGGGTWQFGGQYSVTPAFANTADPVYSNGAQFVSLSVNRASFSSYMCVPTG